LNEQIRNANDRRKNYILEDFKKNEIRNALIVVLML